MERGKYRLKSKSEKIQIKEQIREYILILVLQMNIHINFKEVFANSVKRI